MRVIAGVHGGRRLRAPKGSAVRPTADRVREALFSSLADIVVDADVLDLYAGSGALGIEALSRGAATATFVERSPAVAAVLRANLSELGLAAAVATCSVAAYGRGLCDATPLPPPAAFDLVLADPPYDHDLSELTACLDALRDAGRIQREAVVVVERDRRSTDELPPWLEVRRRRAYGDTVLLQLSRSVSGTSRPDGGSHHRPPARGRTETGGVRPATGDRS